MAEAKQLKVRLVKSLNGRRASHQACARGLGIRRMHHQVTVANTPENRGMINRINYLVEVEEA